MMTKALLAQQPENVKGFILGFILGGARQNSSVSITLLSYIDIFLGCGMLTFMKWNSAHWRQKISQLQQFIDPWWRESGAASGARARRSMCRGC
jgi:hypothetical protein